MDKKVTVILYMYYNPALRILNGAFLPSLPWLFYAQLGTPSSVSLPEQTSSVCVTICVHVHFVFHPFRVSSILVDNAAL